MGENVAVTNIDHCQINVNHNQKELNEWQFQTRMIKANTSDMQTSCSSEKAIVE